MKKDRLNVVFLLSIMVSVMFTITSCSNDDFFDYDYYNNSDIGLFDVVDYHNKSNIDEIQYSNEFHSYIQSKIDFCRLFIDADSTNGIYIDSIKMYRIDLIRPKTTIDSCYSSLISKYPYYKTIPQSLINEMSHQVLKITDNQYKERTTNGANESIKLLRRKRKAPESIAHSFYSYGQTHGHFTYTPFLFYTDAHNACVNYSHNYAKESGGFTFEDYSSLFIIDDRATLTHTNLPNMDFGDNKPDFIYHYHPYSNVLSHDDTLAMETFGCPVYIIHDDYFLYPH